MASYSRSRRFSAQMLPTSPVVVRAKSISDLVFMQGYLSKQGGARGGFKTWHRRWIVLKEEALYYYKSEQDPVLLGTIPLRDASLVTHAEPPAWQDDSVCHECKREFGFLIPKHHCRNCGQIFCHDCSSHSTPIPQLGFDKPVRVCDSCHSELGSSSAPKASSSTLGSLVNMVGNLFSRSEGHVGHVFTLKSPDRSLVLEADTLESKLQWIAAFNTAFAARDAAKQRQEVPAAPPAPLKEQWEIDYSSLVIQEKVGDGSFGEVFKGRLWGTEVAIKRLKAAAVQGSLLDDLKREIAILSTLRHPNVVLYIGACTKPPNVCIVTEWCDRGALSSALQDADTFLPVRMILQQAMSIAQGMNYLHSLQSRIIHRDLKSHNILLDKHFNVKIADFGLSHVRDLVSSSAKQDPSSPSSSSSPKDGSSIRSKGQFGILGTPEWMAPEVMEGAPYNESIDVYSYGIVLTELLSRQRPFADQYKIESYDDVCDAVLDDGAKPTIPEWSRTLLGDLIDACLNRDPDARPSFTDILRWLRDRLGALTTTSPSASASSPMLPSSAASSAASSMDAEQKQEQQPVVTAISSSLAVSSTRVSLSSSSAASSSSATSAASAFSASSTSSVSISSSDSQLFILFDLPRLAEQLESTQSISQLRAAKELTHLCRTSSSTCLQCGAHSGFPGLVSTDHSIPFLMRLTALLSSGDAQVQLAACTALDAMLRCPQIQHGDSGLGHVVRDSGGVAPLLGFLSANDNGPLQRMASSVLTLIAADMTHFQWALLSSKSSSALRHLDALLAAEQARMRARLAAEQQALQQRLAVVERLHDTLAQLDAGILPRQSLRPKGPKNRRRSTLLMLAPTILDGIVEDDEKSPTNVLERVVKIPVQTSLLPPDPSSLTENFVEFFGDHLAASAIHGYAMLLNAQQQVDDGNDDAAEKPPLRWQSVYLFLTGPQANELKVFGSPHDDPCFAELSVAVRALDGSITVKHHEDATASKQKPVADLLAPFESPLRCLEVHDARRYTRFFLAWADRATHLRWAAAFGCTNTPPVHTPHPSLDDETAQIVLSSLAVDAAKALQSQSSLNPSALNHPTRGASSPSSVADSARSAADRACAWQHLPDTDPETVGEELAEFYGNIVHHGHLLVMRDDAWCPFYALLLPKEIRCFSSAESSPYDAEMILYLTSNNGEFVSVKNIEDSVFALVDCGLQTLLCARDVAAQSQWVSSLRKQLTVSASSPEPASPRVSATVVPEIPALELTHQGSSVELEPQPSTAADTVGHQRHLFIPALPRLLSSSNVNFEIPARLLALYGPCTRHGYLWKRGDTIKTWKRRYCYLVENRLFYFSNHQSPSLESPLGIIWTSTGSGKPFLVTRAPSSPAATSSSPWSWFSSTSSSSSSSSTSDAIIKANEPNLEFCFVIAASARLWHIVADSAEDMAAWIEAIQFARESGSAAALASHRSATLSP